MTRKETTAIALKCFALYIIGQVFISLPTLSGIGLKLGAYGDHDTPIFFIASVCFLTVVVGFLFAFLLWKFTNSLMLKETSSEGTPSGIGVDEVMKIILACMGIYFAINAILAFPRSFVEFQLSKTTTVFMPEITFINLVSIGLQFMFGCLLIAKPSSWVNVIKTVREK
jgi:hypothetical protein